MEASDILSVNSIKTEKDVLDILSSSLQPSVPAKETPEVSTDPPLELKDESLTPKKAVEFLLNGTLKKKVCRYCLTVTAPLSELDQILQVAGQGVIYKVTIREMVASFHPFKVADDPNFPNKICEKCIDRTLTSYLFTQQCERSERALRNCFEEMFEKLEKLDPLEKSKKRGRTKSHPNHNVLTAAHEKVIDYAEPLITIINTGSELSSDSVHSNALVCQKCCLTMPNLASLLNHEKLHPASMWYHCHLCGKSFPKRLQLRRHIHNSHATGKLNEVEKTDFKCQDCGTVSIDYHSHLQHIEKHKFQEVMDNLIHRKMDKLCAVCLNKGFKLVELEKMVCLHGGYPEMMGDRTLYNILGSTVPEKSSYKYQELLVPSKVKILSLLRLSKKEDSSISNIPKPQVVLSKDEHKNDTLFLFSFPDFNLEIESSNNNNSTDLICIDDVEKVKNDGTGMPLNNRPLMENSNPENGQLNLELPSHSTKTDNINQELDHNYSKSLSVVSKFTSSKPVLNKEAENYDEMVMENTENINKLCKTCWIYKKAVCKICLAFTNVENVDDGMQECPSCWLFKNCKQCGVCKKSNIKELCNTTNDSIKILEYIDLDVETGTNINPKTPKSAESSESNGIQCPSDHNNLICDDKKTKKQDDLPSVDLEKKMVKPKKRKITEDSCDEKTKRSKWQCQICFTTNWKRESCFCCDSARNYSNVKYNFKFNNDFFDDLNNNKEEGKTELVTSELEIKIKENILEHQAVLISDKNIQLAESSSLCIKDNIYFESRNIVSSINNASKNIIAKATIVEHDTAMTVDQIENLFDSQPTESYSEDMEIVENDIEVNLCPYKGLQNQILTPELQPICFKNQLTPPQLQFNFGISEATPNKTGRRILRRSKKCTKQ